MKIKIYIQWILLLSLYSYACYNLMHEPHGIIASNQLHAQLLIKKASYAKNVERNNCLKQQIQEYLRNPFYSEKIAREELHLGYAYEYVYLLKS